MIIAGYQCIGKTTLAKKNDKIIDLDIKCFWEYEKFIINNKEKNEWYVNYCRIAQDLSRQGYTVFVPCQKQIRHWLNIHNTEKFCAIFPIKKMKDDWIKKLQKIYDKSKTKTDLNILEHIKNSYENDIYELMYESSYNVEYYHNVVFIDDMNYDLRTLIDNL